MSKGIMRGPHNYRRIKSSRERMLQGASSYVETKLPTYKSHQLEKDELGYLLPVIKEIGKALYPPAAMPIEILYQLYTHADAIKEVSTAVMNSDYKTAEEVLVKSATGDLAGSTLGKIEAPTVNKASDSLAKTATKNVEGKLEKEITRRVVKGTTKGVVESANKNVVDDITDEVLKRKEKQ